MSIIWMFDRKYTVGGQEECVGIYFSSCGDLSFSLHFALVLYISFSLYFITCSRSILLSLKLF